MLRPFPLLEQLLGEGVAVGTALGIEARAGIAIPVPGAADLGAGLEHAYLQAHLAQAVELVHAGQAGADDDGVEIEFCSVLRNLVRRGRHWPLLPIMFVPRLAGL